jgi:CheY-like chemotaxis protein
MSHEIRTPMNAILGFAYLLTKVELNADAADLVRKIRNAGRSLQGIINDILDFSKIEAGRLEIEVAPFCLSDVLDNVAGIMAANAVHDEVTLLVSEPPGVDWLMGDALRIEQILVNLVSNAIKFTAEGHVELTVERLHLDMRQCRLRFCVRDTGIGIAPDQLERVFSPFAQADVSTTRRYGGTGLGLAICRQLVSLMGGSLDVHSEVGRGSEFRFDLDLPRAENADAAAPVDFPFVATVATENMLLGGTIRRTLEQMDWHVKVVGSCTELLGPGKFRPNPAAPNLLLLDWPADHQAALALIDQVRSADAAAVIIVLTTAKDRDAVVAQTSACRVSAVLNKPVTRASIRNCIDMAATRSANAPSASHFPAAGLRLQGIRVLAADDSDINREVIQRVLAYEGATVALVENGQQAVDWLKQHPKDVDIVLMDLQMPVLDGFDATRKIRAEHAFDRLPILALTAGVFNEHREAAAKAGMDGFIPKPVDVESAVIQIRQALGTEPAAAQPETPAPPLGEHLAAEQDAYPGLAIDAGLKIWLDAAVYRKYLRKFSVDYAGVAAKLACFAPHDAAAEAHKLKGAAANLALVEVAECAGELERLFRHSADANAALARLQSAMDTALASVALYLAADPSLVQAAVAPRADTSLTLGLLHEALVACDSDNPAMVEPILNKLAAMLPREQLAPPGASLADFDFRACEHALKALIATVQTSSEG